MQFARSRSLPSLSNHPLRQPLALAAAPRTRPTGLTGSSRTRFAAHRFHRTVELIGACVMMAAFLMLALFA